VQADGPVIYLHRIERTLGDGHEFLGYWTSKGARRVADPWRRFAWVVLRRLPRSYCAVRRELAAPPPAPPRPGPGTREPRPPQPPPHGHGPRVREPRRPLPPSLTGAAALPLPGDEQAPPA
jgi:hypothetical protein